MMAAFADDLSRLSFFFAFFVFIFSLTTSFQHKRHHAKFTNKKGNVTQCNFLDHFSAINTTTI